MNEKDFQRRLFFMCDMRGDEIICPSTRLFPWTSDMICVTESARIHEYEIKVTRSDFRSDLRKERHQKLLQDKRYGPSRFWYVAPEGIIAKDDLPEYAGLILLRDGKLRVEHRAPERHRANVTIDQRITLYRSMMRRFWRMRIGEPREAENV